jgi:hypothetical protein
MLTRKSKNMNMCKYSRFIKGALFIPFAFFIVNSWSSCNKAYPDLLTENYPQGNNAGANVDKVLYIIVDGLSGTGVRSIAPPNIAKLTQNAIYTYNGLADIGSGPLTLSTAWADQLTGVHQEMHNVNDNSYEGDSLSFYPGVIDLLKSVKPSLKSSAFCASTEFYDHYALKADKHQNFSGQDNLVANEVVKSLKTDSSDLVLAQFHGVDSVETAYGVGSVQYTQAVMRTDGYIGDIMNALKERPDYLHENWLVIVISSMGTPQINTAATPFADSSRNIFSLFYNPSFNKSFLDQPSITQVAYNGNGPRYTYANDNYVNATLSNDTAYNIGSKGDYTIQFLVKNLNTITNMGYPTMLSKRDADFTGPGWNIFIQGNYWGINSSIDGQAFGTTILDNQWHVLTTVFHRDSGISSIRVYTDGVFNQEVSRTYNTDKVDNEAPLRIGRLPTNGNTDPDLLIRNLQIYNVAFSDSDVVNLSPITEIATSHKYYSNLIGYWPCDETGQRILTERTGNLGLPGLDFKLTGPYSWFSFNDLSPYLRPPLRPSFYQLVPNSYDVPIEILQWFGIPVESQWKLVGRGWTPTYSFVTP